MTKTQSCVVGLSLIFAGVGLSLFGWVAHVPESVTLGGVLFGAGLGALGIPRPRDV